MSETFEVFKTTGVPGTLVPNSVIFAAPADPTKSLEIYVVNNAGTATRKIVNDDRVIELITQQLVQSNAGKLTIVNDIAARDAIENKYLGLEVLVLDATADTSVNSSWARYVYVGDNTWLKGAEGESVEMIQAWGNITGGPQSTPELIDDAVSKRHAHANKTQLDKVSEDTDGNLLYNGDRPSIAWNTVNW